MPATIVAKVTVNVPHWTDGANAEREANADLLTASWTLREAVKALLAAYAPGAEATVQEEGESALHSSVQLARHALDKANGIGQ
jgi:hypothetical protein